MLANKTNPSTLFYLFKTFLIVGASSFGGYSALVAVVQNLMVERDKTISNEIIVKGFSIASLLPGPVAVNTVAYIGYSLKGWPGALLSMAGVLLPSMVLMIVLAFLYQAYADFASIKYFLAGVIPVVMAVIAAAAFNMGVSSLKSTRHFFILIVVLAIQFYIRGYWSFVISFAVGGALGYWLFNRKGSPLANNLAQGINRRGFSFRHGIVVLFLLLALLLNFADLPVADIRIELAKVFSGISLTLFGGGYVMIPMLNEIIVVKKMWLTSNEFIDAIALGQITPGPILISATFIGYKMSGIAGAVIATVSIFFPSGMLMILVSEIFARINQNTVWKSVFEGLKPVVVALIIISVLIMSYSIENWWLSGLIFLISVVLIIKYRINFLWLILVAGSLGVILLDK